MEKIKCSDCFGRKKIVGLGMIERECKACDGNGWKEAEIPIEKVSAPKKSHKKEEVLNG